MTKEKEKTQQESTPNFDDYNDIPMFDDENPTKDTDFEKQAKIDEDDVFNPNWRPKSKESGAIQGS